jgi:xylulose-5-phosphate/fructose-6-phosphate phosphoketolase
MVGSSERTLPGGKIPQKRTETRSKKNDDNVNACDKRAVRRALEQMNAWWRAANYLNTGQIYLSANPLIRKPLKPEHIKPRLLGRWGTSPGLSLIYVHLNRMIKQYDLDVIYMAGPGHGGPALVANVYLEGNYTEHFPEVTQDEKGLLKLPAVLDSGRHSEPR